MLISILVTTYFFLTISVVKGDVYMMTFHWKPYPTCLRGWKIAADLFSSTASMIIWIPRSEALTAEMLKFLLRCFDKFSVLNTLWDHSSYLPSTNRFLVLVPVIPVICFLIFSWYWLPALMAWLLPAAARKNVYSIRTGIGKMVCKIFLLVGKIFYLPIEEFFLDIVGNCPGQDDSL